MAVMDVAFPLQGKEIPADHGYWVFSAVSKMIPSLHGDLEVAIHPIGGRLVGDQRLALTRRSCIIFRVSYDHLPELMVLTGQSLRVADEVVSLGLPRVVPLKPAANLWSRLVTVKGFLEPETFLQAAKRQLDELGIHGVAALLPVKESNPLEGGTGTRSPFVRRTLRIRDKTIVGYALSVNGLTAEESIHLQEIGLGGRRRFGCGVFVPQWG